MSTLNNIALILALASCLYNVAVEARPIDDNIKAVDMVQLSIQAGLPEGSSPVHVVCDDIVPNRSFEFDLPSSGVTKNLSAAVFATYKCEATWNGKKASFDAYDKTRDADQKNIYWILDPLGFYESYDNREWKRLGGW